MSERLECSKWPDKAVLFPDQYCSNIIDGADRSAFGLPQVVTKTKRMRQNAIEVRPIGLMENDKRNKVQLITMIEEHRTGANHIVEVRHRYLIELSSLKRVPTTFYIQVENCTRESKNRYFFGYVESLLCWNVFKKVQASFLPASHTHEDIDQAFSNTSERLRSADAVFLNDVHAELRCSYGGETTVVHWRSVINWSGLREQESVLESALPFSQCHNFSFTCVQRDESRKHRPVSCQMKNKACDSWTPLRQGSSHYSLSFIKTAPDLEGTPPSVIHRLQENGK